MNSHIQTVRRKQSDGSVKEHYYLRPPIRMQHILGKRIRLPNEPAEAKARAAELLGQSVESDALSAGRARRFAKKAHDNAFSRANKRGQSYSLSPDAILLMMRSQNYRCAISGLPFSLDWSDGRNPFAPSLDRINNGLGYTPDNTRLVLSAVNYGLNVWGVEIYAAICAAVAQKQNVFASFDVNRFQKPVNGPNSGPAEP